MILAHPASSAEREPVRLRSAGAIDVRLIEGGRQVRFADSVLFDYGSYHLTAGRLTLDEEIGRAWAEGGVSLAGPGGRAQASRVWIELATERLVLEDFEARLGPWWASARRAEIVGERVDLYNTVMSACPGPTPLYSLRARQLSKESPVRFVARGVVPYFYVVPLFYLPKYSYDLEKEEYGDTLVPSRQGFEFTPGRGNFTGIFLKTLWRKKFFDRRLISTIHVDYYSKPGFAVGDEIQYRSPTTDHYTFAYFTRARTIRREGYTRGAGHENRWRLWQYWNRKLPFGHFKTFINEVSDSSVEDDYRFKYDERRLMEREIASELVFDRPNMRLKLIGERLMTLDPRGPKEYRLDRRRLPAIQFLTFPFPLLPRRADDERRGWRFYGLIESLAARGKDRPDRAAGAFGTGRIAAITSVPLASRLSVTTEVGVRSEYYDKKIPGEADAATQIGSGKIVFHRPWMGEWLQSDFGYSNQKAWTNKNLYSSGGVVENLAFLTFRKFRPVWKTSLDLGYDFRPGIRQMAPIDFQSRLGGSRSSFTSILRYHPQRHRFQSIYTNAWLKLGSVFYTGLGAQTVRTDTEDQVQFTPWFKFESPRKIYRLRYSGFYDAKFEGWRSHELYLTKAFNCIETTLGLSKRDKDFQINLSFNLTGFKKPEDLFQKDEFGGR